MNTQDNWFGKALPDTHCELIGMSRIAEEHRVDEAEVFQSKWLGYADMHPVRATYFFAHVYKQQTKWWIEATQDLRDADSTPAFNGVDIFLSTEYTAMWLARQAADRYGMPYDFYLAFAARRARDRFFHRFPRPNQLYGEEFELDAKAEWDETLGRSLQYARDPQTRQDPEHVSFVVGQIKARSLPHHNLLARMFREGVLVPEKLGQTFDAATVARAQAVALTLG
jgi:hypothetical protein